MSAIFGTVRLDTDEFSFIREPYEIIGGDYTMRYISDHDLASAFRTARKSYFFYWKYRPLNSPIINETDKKIFEVEEKKFGYVRPDRVMKGDPDAFSKYSKRLIVPETDRFYSHGAGKPLLPAVVSIPQLALVKLVTSENQDLLYLQYKYNYHPVFILVRLAQIVAGLSSILIVYWIIAREYGTEKALLGASIMALFPLSIKYFPNLHHDSILVPFGLLSSHYFSREQYKWSGIFWGLALASKNVAIILPPAFMVSTAWEAWTLRRNTAKGVVRNLLHRRIKGFVIVVGFGILFLFPFANPISYAREILTPITHRDYDHRGEDVSKYTISSKLEPSKSDDSRSVLRPELKLAKRVLRFQDVSFFFLVTAVFLLLMHAKTPFMRISLILLLFTLPLGVVFGYGLTYRKLLFVPFAVMLWVDVAPRRYLIGFLALLICIDILYCIDPITTDTIHYPVNNETFLGAFARWIGIH